MKKRGNILAENIIFIILNLIFLTILVLFLFSKISGAAVLEEKYAKQIALIIDSAEPVMEINLDVGEMIKEAKDNSWELNNVITINDNLVTVKLRKKGGYSYSFFNNVDVMPYYAGGDRYILTVNEK